jgi:hypothetical protein
MDDLSKKPDLDDEQIRRLYHIMAEKANIWFISGGRMSEGIEVFRTQDDEIFIIRDVETDVKIGMRKEVTNEGVVTKLSFFKYTETETENE